MISLTTPQALIRITVGLILGLLFNQTPFAAFVAQQSTGFCWRSTFRGERLTLHSCRRRN